jgi:hypothetical protein
MLRKSDYQIRSLIISTEVGGDLGSIRDELRAKYAAGARDSRRGAPQRKVGEPLTLVALAGDPDKLVAIAPHKVDLVVDNVGGSLLSQVITMRGYGWKNQRGGAHWRRGFGIQHSDLFFRRNRIGGVTVSD